MSTPKKGNLMVQVFHLIAKSESEALPGQLTPAQAEKFLSKKPLRRAGEYKPRKPAEGETGEQNTENP